MYCPYCNSRSVILDPERGEYVCTNCGTVIDVLYMPSRSQLDNEPLLPTSDEVSLDVNHSELTTRERRRHYMIKLRRIEKSVKSRLRIEKRAVACLKNMAHRLGLNDRQVELALEILKKLLKKYGTGIDRRDISSYKIAAAATLYAVLVHNLPISPREIVDQFQKSGHKISTSELFRILTESLGKVVNTTSQRVRTYIEYIISKLQIDPTLRMSLLKTCNEVIMKIPQRRICGKSPKTLAAAIVLYSAKKSKIPVSPIELSTILNVSPITLREHVRKIEKTLKNGEP